MSFALMPSVKHCKDKTAIVYRQYLLKINLTCVLTGKCFLTLFLFRALTLDLRLSLLQIFLYLIFLKRQHMAINIFFFKLAKTNTHFFFIWVIDFREVNKSSRKSIKCKKQMHPQVLPLVFTSANFLKIKYDPAKIYSRNCLRRIAANINIIKNYISDD